MIEMRIYTFQFVSYSFIAVLSVSIRQTIYFNVLAKRFVFSYLFVCVRMSASLSVSIRIEALYID